MPRECDWEPAHMYRPFSWGISGRSWRQLDGHRPSWYSHRRQKGVWWGTCCALSLTGRVRIAQGLRYSLLLLVPSFVISS